MSELQGGCSSAYILEICNANILLSGIVLTSISFSCSLYQAYVYIKLSRLHKGVIRLIFHENIATGLKSGFGLAYLVVSYMALQKSIEVDDDSTDIDNATILLEGAVLSTQVWCLIWTVFMAWVINKTVTSIHYIMGLKKIKSDAEKNFFAKMGFLFTNSGIGWAVCIIFSAVTLPIHFYMIKSEKEEYLIYFYLPVIIIGNMYIIGTLVRLLLTHSKTNAIGNKVFDKRDRKIRKIVQVLIWFPITLLITSIPNLISICGFGLSSMKLGSLYWQISFLIYFVQGLIDTVLFNNLPPVHYQAKKERNYVKREKETFFAIYMIKWIFLIKNVEEIHFEDFNNDLKEDLLLPVQSLSNTMKPKEGKIEKNESENINANVTTIFSNPNSSLQIGQEGQEQFDIDENREAHKNSLIGQSIGKSITDLLFHKDNQKEEADDPHLDDYDAYSEIHTDIIPNTE